MLVVGGTFPNSTQCDAPVVYGFHNLDLSRNNVDKSKWALFDYNKTGYTVPPELVDKIGGTGIGGASKKEPDNGFDHPDLSVYFTRKYSAPSRTPTRPIPKSTNTPDDDGLSKGTIMGAAIGGGLGFILLVSLSVLGCCLFQRRRLERRTNRASEQQQQQPMMHTVPHVSSVDYSNNYGLNSPQSPTNHDPNHHSPRNHQQYYSNSAPTTYPPRYQAPSPPQQPIQLPTHEINPPPVELAERMQSPFVKGRDVLASDAIALPAPTKPRRIPSTTMSSSTSAYYYATNTNGYTNSQVNANAYATASSSSSPPPPPPPRPPLSPGAMSSSVPTDTTTGAISPSSNHGQWTGSWPTHHSQEGTMRSERQMSGDSSIIGTPMPLASAGMHEGSQQPLYYTPSSP